jgi:hypothetical protein
MSDKCTKCSSDDLSGSVYRPTCNRCGYSVDPLQSEENVIYMLVQDGAEWEDMSIILKKEDAIAASIKYQQCRVEIFTKKTGHYGYTPSYNYYKNGELKLTK